jgi:hypothetical protein
VQQTMYQVMRERVRMSFLVLLQSAARAIE